MLAVKFLEFVKPFCAVMPEISKPERRVRAWFPTGFADSCLPSVLVIAALVAFCSRALYAQLRCVRGVGTLAPLCSRADFMRSTGAEYEVTGTNGSRY